MTIDVDGPDGSSFSFPDGTPHEEISGAMDKHYGNAPAAPTDHPAEKPPGPMSWGDVAKGAVTSAPGSAVEFGKSVVQPFIHPIETATNLKNIAQGALEKAGAIGTTGHEQYADAVGKFFADRYGGIDQFKRTLSTDPVGVAADLSAIFTGGGSAAARAPGILGRAGEVAAQAGRAIDPIANAARVAAPVGRVAGQAAAEVIGGLTHTGAMPVETAFRSGYEGGQAGQAFRENIRNVQPMEETVEDARRAIQNMRQQRGQAYRNSMVGLSANQATYPGIWADIGQAARRAGSVATFRGQSLSPTTQTVRQNIADAISHWHSLPPADFHTLEGFDALKRQIGDIRDGTQYGTPERRVADEMYHGVRNAIVNADPEYGRTMRAYEQASHQLREIERTLSVPPNHQTGPTVDTALRKLQSTLRDNVNTSFGRRRELLQYLLDNGAPHLLEQLAGQAMRPWLPRGLGRLGMQLGAEMLALGGAHAMTGPAALAAAPLAVAQSPRMMGEASHYAGIAARYLEAAAPHAPVRSGFQAGRLPVAAGVPRRAEDTEQQPTLAQRASGGRAVNTRVQSHYRSNGGTKDHRCGVCAHFKAPHACSIVSGTIATHGVCDWYKAARASGGSVTDPADAVWRPQPGFPHIPPIDDYEEDNRPHAPPPKEQGAYRGGRAMSAGGLPDDIKTEVYPDSPQTVGTHHEPSYGEGEASQEAAEAAAARVRAPYAQAASRVGGLDKGLGDLASYFGNKVASAFKAPGEALYGQMQVTDPETGMPTKEAMERAQGIANLAMTSGMPMAKPGALGMFGGMPTYSGAGAAARAAKNEVAHSSQWLGPRTERNYIEKNPKTGEETPRTEVKYSGIIGNSPGVKPEEIEHIGLPEWLKSQNGKVTREQVNQYIESKQPQVQEVVKSEGNQKSRDVLIQENMNRGYTRPEAEQTADRQLNEGYMSSMYPTSETKYSQYQLPGGSNYGETLLTLPSKTPDKLPKDWSINREPDGNHYVYNSEGQMVAGGATPREATSNALFEIGSGGPRTEGQTTQEYRSSHWDEPNVLLHVRHNDRTVPGPNGEQMNALHMEEVQSDWHQAGRKHGYKDPTGNYEGASPVEASVKEANGVPDAPFKTTWPDLALKRMLHRASTERNPDGSYKYDALSWTPGEAQAARYDLSHHVDHIDHFKNPDGTYNVAAMKGHEQIWHDDRATPEAIEKNIGKEMADKITQGEGKDIGSNWQPGTRRLSGVDLKVGGAGMKSFYDKMLPDKANALTKKFGAKVERQSVPVDSTPRSLRHFLDWAAEHGDERPRSTLGEAWSRGTNDPAVKRFMEDTKAQPVHLLRITPALRAAAEKGFPTFARGGRIKPTEAQKEAGNYKKRRVSIHGLPISIENEKGSERSGVGKDGKPWSVKMPAAYGYLRRTEGADGDHVDTYLGPHAASKKVFVIDQKDAETGKFDETKCMLGFGSAEMARQHYLRGFSDGKGKQRLGHMTEMSIDEFRKWLREGDTTKPARAA